MWAERRQRTRGGRGVGERLQQLRTGFGSSRRVRTRVWARLAVSQVSTVMTEVTACVCYGWRTWGVWTCEPTEALQPWTRSNSSEWKTSTRSERSWEGRLNSGTRHGDRTHKSINHIHGCLNTKWISPAKTHERSQNIRTMRRDARTNININKYWKPKETKFITQSYECIVSLCLLLIK